MADDNQAARNEQRGQQRHLYPLPTNSSDNPHKRSQRWPEDMSSPQSYVYPVRSLLAGVQPVSQGSPPPPPGLVGAIGSPPSTLSMQQLADQLKQIDNSSFRTRSNSGTSNPTDSQESPYIPLKIAANSRFVRPSSQSEPFSSNAPLRSPRTPRSPSGAPDLPTVQEERSVGHTTVPDDAPGLSMVSHEGDGQSVVIRSSDRDPDGYNPRHPEPVATAYTNPTFRQPKAVYPAAGSGSGDDYASDFHLSGIVHLPPLPSQSTSERGSSVMSGNASGGSLSSSRYPHVVKDSVASSSGSDSRGIARRGARDLRRAPAGTSGSDSQGDSAGDGIEENENSITNSSQSDLVTFRFEHVLDENGFHVLTGREGSLIRCEDEPIHAPGAVQGFGVLIAVEEDDESGNLVVRQVSENSTELLGLSPRYLFDLECFTQTLPDSQADLLWDNVQFVNESEMSGDDKEESAENPQVFLLSGWGEPGSAASDEEDELAKEGDRRFWTCWCAVHRPPLKKQFGGNEDAYADAKPPRNLIVLEFELERDLYNPLYPAFQTEMYSGGTPDSMSGGNRTSSAMSSGSSTATTFSRGSGASTEMYTAATVTPNNPAFRSFAGATPLVREVADEDESSTVPVSDLSNINPAELFLSARQGLDGHEQWFPSPEDVFESTTSQAKPLKALERMRRMNRTLSHPAVVGDELGGGNPRMRARQRRGNQSGVGTMDIFAVLAQVNDQLSSAPDLESFLKIVVGVIKDLTQFHRVLVYQFDEQWNGQVVAELVDWRQTHDLYKGLHFPASDIPAQARDLYKINKVRLLYNRMQTVARLVVRSREDLETPLDMTHSFLRAMSPIHIKYLANMGVQSSMSISIITFGALWGLISCHSYGLQGMRVSFPVRQMLRLLSDSISRNIERLSYAQRLHTRKLISTLPTDSHPTGYIVSNAEDLLSLFDADFGVLVIGEGAKILGANRHGQEILLVAEYLRLKQFTLMQVSHSVANDFPDLLLPGELEVIAGLLCVPLSRGGKDFIVFLRKGQLRDVHWAGKPYKDGTRDSVLEPRKSFKIWSETVTGRCRAWTEEQMETAGVLALIYGKFIEVWRQKESALQTTQLTNILLSNASHEVRTPLNHIINYLEMALNGPLDNETRENLSRSHSASKSLLFTINDLLDLTRLEIGNETSFNEPFDLPEAITEAIQLYKNEASRRNIEFILDLSTTPGKVIGDAKKIRTVVANLTANAVKYTREGEITVSCHTFNEPRGLRNAREVAVEISVSDTGCGIEESKLEHMFREFERAESSISRGSDLPGLGLGLAVVARIVEQLGGQLRAESKPSAGARFSFLIPFELAPADIVIASPKKTVARTTSRNSSDSSELESIVEALQSDHMKTSRNNSISRSARTHSSFRLQQTRHREGTFEVTDSRFPIKSVKVDTVDADKPVLEVKIKPVPETPSPPAGPSSQSSDRGSVSSEPTLTLRILVVEDDPINRIILAKRLTLDGHKVVETTNGQESVNIIQDDRDFDCILMDIQMPILNGFDASKAIRVLEKTSPPPERKSTLLNGRIPIFAVSASLREKQREEIVGYGMDGWILKPIDFKRLHILLGGILNPEIREYFKYKPGCNWEAGGWFKGHDKSQPEEVAAS